MNKTTFIIFGITGDLARRKLIPALCRLIENDTPNSFLVIGAGREEISKEEIFQRSSGFTATISLATKERFMQSFFYQRVDVADQDSFSGFAHFIEKIERSRNAEVLSRIVYCATASNLFIPITKGLAHTNIIRKNSNDKIVYEKPFGNSKENAQAVNKCIQEHFDEKQIFRVDHYLSKELVRTILNIRFSNSIFETQFDNKHIEQIQVIAREKIGIEGRSSYYEMYGAVKDMVQNHLLSLLALLTLEKPEIVDNNTIAKSRRDLLKAVVFNDGLLGQCVEYKNEQGVSPDSTTETFAALVFFIENNRWSGVPFYLETGKYLEKKETIIRIKFKPLQSEQIANWLTIEIAPESKISLSLHIKSPKSQDELITVPLEFCHSCVFAADTSEAYEALLRDVLLGNRWSAIDPQEIEQAWDIAESVFQKKLSLLPYKNQSNGPDRETSCGKFSIVLK